MKDRAYALIEKIETLSSLLRATSELGSSIPHPDPRVRDLLRLVDLAAQVAERVEREAAALTADASVEPARSDGESAA